MSNDCGKFNCNLLNNGECEELGEECIGDLCEQYGTCGSCVDATDCDQA